MLLTFERATRATGRPELPQPNNRKIEALTPLLGVQLKWDIPRLPKRPEGFFLAFDRALRLLPEQFPNG